MKKVLITLMMSMFVYQAMAATKFQYEIPQPDRIAPVGEEDDGGSVDLGGIGGGSGTGDSQDPGITIIMGGDGDHTINVTVENDVDAPMPYATDSSGPYYRYGYQNHLDFLGSATNATFVFDNRNIELAKAFLDIRGNFWVSFKDELGNLLSVNDDLYNGLSIKINGETLAINPSNNVGSDYYFYPVGQSVIDAITSEQQFTLDIYYTEPVASGGNVQVNAVGNGSWIGWYQNSGSGVSSHGIEDFEVYGILTYISSGNLELYHSITSPTTPNPCDYYTSITINGHTFNCVDRDEGAASYSLWTLSGYGLTSADVLMEQAREFEATITP